jgi:hypothetical protein
MKTFRDYLTESKKPYAFRVKIAGDVPEGFKENLKSNLESCNATLTDGTKTPVQKLPLDFPELSNMEVTIFDLVTEYPITPAAITKRISEMGLDESYFRVRGIAEPTEIEQEQFQAEKSGESLLASEYANEKIKHKNYFGDDFNKGFLQQLSKDAKARKKELGHNESAMKDVDVLGTNKTTKEDKAGCCSPVGSK